MLRKIEHRGPDSNGISISGNVALGATRLSIIDLSNQGDMPMKDNDDNFEIVFNGEIYNFKEIKKNLILRPSPKQILK